MGRDSKLEQAIVRYAQWVVRWRWGVAIGMFLAVLAAASGAQHLGWSTNYRVFFGDDNPDLAAFEAMQDIYTKNDNILLVVTPDDGAIDTALLERARGGVEGGEAGGLFARYDIAGSA